MLHPDYQYSPHLIVPMTGMIAYGEYDAVIASRILGKGALEGGMPLDFDEVAAHKLLDVPEVVIEADLHLGEGLATVWTCDYSYDYIKINAEYRT